MFRIKRGLTIGIAVAMLLALPASAFAAGAYSQGATIRITGAHLVANVAVVVDVAVACQPINGNTQLTLGYGPGQSDVAVTITQRVGKSVASGSGMFNGQNTTITCDGTTVSNYQINVLPSGTVPFSRGMAAMDASTFIQDLSLCCSGPYDRADTGLINVNITR
jgi:hypothetical protein